MKTRIMCIVVCALLVTLSRSAVADVCQDYAHKIAALNAALAVPILNDSQAGTADEVTLQAAGAAAVAAIIAAESAADRAVAAATIIHQSDRDAVDAATRNHSAIAHVQAVFIAAVPAFESPRRIPSPRVHVYKMYDALTASVRAAAMVIHNAYYAAACRED